MDASCRARAIALYLPQFHPIPENDAWWGRGFTEWTNTAKARPLFRGHYQPHVPADLGFYDLRVAESRTDQAIMAREHGVEAFCYYHYWFAGRRILERPFTEVLASGEPNFPFCLCWANESWTGVWHGSPGTTLIEQTYPGEEDHRRHFESLLPAFLDPRYVRTDGHPVFLVYLPRQLPDTGKWADLWRSLAARAGLPGLHLVAVNHTLVPEPIPDGFDARMLQRLPTDRLWYPWSSPFRKVYRRVSKAFGRPAIYAYRDAVRTILPDRLPDDRSYPMVLPNWDNSPRCGARGITLHGSTPELFRAHLRQGLDVVQTLPAERRFLFVKSWNEWAEGNHLEPDVRFGRGYLDVMRDELGVTSAGCNVPPSATTRSNRL
ncbi:MAG: glycoside hydrolase family 99-like domain-containing protein [Gemmatimonadota bacterium]